MANPKGISRKARRAALQDLDRKVTGVRESKILKDILSYQSFFGRRNCGNI